MVCDTKLNIGLATLPGGTQPKCGQSHIESQVSIRNVGSNHGRSCKLHQSSMEVVGLFIRLKRQQPKERTGGEGWIGTLQHLFRFEIIGVNSCLLHRMLLKLIVIGEWKTHQIWGSRLSSSLFSIRYKDAHGNQQLHQLQVIHHYDQPQPQHHHQQH